MFKKSLLLRKKTSSAWHDNFTTIFRNWSENALDHFCVFLLCQIIVNKESEGDTWKTIKSEVKLLHVNTSQMLRVSLLRSYTGLLHRAFSIRAPSFTAPANGAFIWNSWNMAPSFRVPSFAAPEHGSFIRGSFIWGSFTWPLLSGLMNINPSLRFPVNGSFIHGSCTWLIHSGLLHMVPSFRAPVRGSFIQGFYTWHLHSGFLHSGLLYMASFI